MEKKREKERQYSWTAIVLILVMGFLAYFFLNIYYNSKISNIFMAFIFIILLFFSYRKSVYLLTLASTTSIFIFISLCISFGKLYGGDSPLALNIVLGQWSIFIITLIFTLIVLYSYLKLEHKNKFPLILLIVY